MGALRWGLAALPVAAALLLLWQLVGAAPPTQPAPAPLASPTGSPGAAVAIPIGGSTADVDDAAPEVPEPGTRPVELEVLEAYLAYWRAYSDAVLYLDFPLVEPWLAGREALDVEREIERLRAEGLALRISVEHDPQAILMSRSEARVVDRLTSRSFYVDAGSLEPAEREIEGELLFETTTMELTGERWRVVGSARSALP